MSPVLEGFQDGNDLGGAWGTGFPSQVPSSYVFYVFVTADHQKS